MSALPFAVLRRGDTVAWARRNLPANWHTLRTQTLARDHWTCTECGHHDPTGRTLECDHIGDRDNHDPVNLRTLCQRCHRRRTDLQAQAGRGVGPLRRRPPVRHPGLR